MYVQNQYFQSIGEKKPAVVVELEGIAKTLTYLLFNRYN